MSRRVLSLGFTLKGLGFGALAALVACDDVACPSGTMLVDNHCLQTNAASSEPAAGSAGTEAPGGTSSPGSDARSASAGVGASAGEGAVTGGQSNAAGGAATAGGASSAMAGGSAQSNGTPASQPCSEEGALRCAAAAGQRESCTSGVWVAATPCAPTEVCSVEAASAPGTCRPVAEICQGSAGQPVCDGMGVLYKCDAQGVVASMETCQSARHCQVGVAMGACPMCIPGEHRCTGVHLERCADDGSAFMPGEDCETVALCNAKTGACTDAACVLGKFSCERDVLQKCNAAQTAFEKVDTCKSGMCDEAGGQCDECVPGSKVCQGNSVATCDPTGQKLNMVPCSGNAAHCVGMGQCVACAADADCPDPGVCKVKHCNKASGTCEPTLAASRATCSGGLCDGSGSCVACLTANDCTADPGTCRVKACSGGKCTPQPAAKATPCGSDVCDGAGKCVECVDAKQCPSTMTCTGNNTCGCGGSTPQDCNGACIGAKQCCGSCSGANQVCNASHECTCNSSSTMCNGVCIGTKQCCGSCSGANQVCNASHECECNSNSKMCNGACVSKDTCCGSADKGRPCSSNGGRFCDGGTKCVQCLAPSDCDQETQVCNMDTGHCDASLLYHGCIECNKGDTPYHCNSFNVCVPSGISGGACPGNGRYNGVSVGGGECVAKCNGGACPSNTECTDAGNGLMICTAGG